MLSKRNEVSSEKSPESPNLKKTKTPSQKSNDSLGPSLLSTAEFKLYRHGSLKLAKNRLESVFLENESNGQIPLFVVTDTMNYLENLSGAGVKSKKLKLIVELFNFALDHEPTSLAWVYMIFSCKVFPDYDNRDFGIGNSFLYKFISSISKKSETSLKKEMKKVGDLGSLAANYISTSTPAKNENALKVTFGYWFSKVRELTGISVINCKITERGHRPKQKANFIFKDAYKNYEPKRNKIHDSTDPQKSANRRLQIDRDRSTWQMFNGQFLRPPKLVQLGIVRLLKNQQILV